VASRSQPARRCNVTAVPGIALGVARADCAPVLFRRPGRRIIGARMAGWRGALAG